MDFGTNDFTLKIQKQCKLSFHGYLAERGNGYNIGIGPRLLWTCFTVDKGKFKMLYWIADGLTYPWRCTLTKDTTSFPIEYVQSISAEHHGNSYSIHACSSTAGWTRLECSGLLIKVPRVIKQLEGWTAWRSQRFSARALKGEQHR